MGTPEPGIVRRTLRKSTLYRVRSRLHAKLLTRMSRASYTPIILPSVTQSLGRNSGKKTFFKISCRFLSLLPYNVVVLFNIAKFKSRRQSNNTIKCPGSENG